jgi:hypothetical protein
VNDASAVGGIRRQAKEGERVQLTITEQERDLLLKVVEQYYGNLREEIYKTEGHGFKEELKGEETVVEALLKKLRP